MMKRAFQFLITTIFLFFASVGFGEMVVIKNVVIYEIKTDEPISFAWADANPEIPNKEFEIYLYNRGEQMKYINGKTGALQMTVMIPKTGFYEVYLRSCNPAIIDSDNKCSEWISSFEKAVDSKGIVCTSVQDENGNLIDGKWLIYAHVAAPKDGGIVNQ
jgi:hypothetical protein